MRIEKKKKRSEKVDKTMLPRSLDKRDPNRKKKTIYKDEKVPKTVNGHCDDN